jgi:hypothetical protein
VIIQQFIVDHTDGAFVETQNFEDRTGSTVSYDEIGRYHIRVEIGFEGI